MLTYGLLQLSSLAACGLGWLHCRAPAWNRETAGRARSKNYLMGDLRHVMTSQCFSHKAEIVILISLLGKVL